MNKDRKQAVALSYKQDQNDAPYVSAKGEGEVADKILQLAKENGVPIQEDSSLVSLLSQVDLFHAIPPDLYEAVAEIFAFIYSLDRRQGNK